MKKEDIDPGIIQLASPHIFALLSEERSSVLTQLKDIYRSGKSDAAVLMSKAGQLSMLDDMENKIRRIVLTMNKKEKEVLNGKQSGNTS